MNRTKNTKFSIRNLLIVVISINILLILYHFLTCWMCQRLATIHHFRNETSFNSSNRMFDIPDFKYLISKPECDQNGSAPYFVTLVHTSPTQFNRRAANRRTWMSDHDPRTKVYFLMGTVKMESLQRKIDDEESKYHDIIQGNFVDSYHNLTYKHTMALKWFTENCPNVKYLLKIDDDVFVNVPAVYEYLVNNKNDTNFILGVYFPPFRTAREGKWKTSVQDIRDRYIPEYASGQSIIYSNDFVREAFKRTFTTRFLWIDDLFVSGYIRMQMNVRIEPIYKIRLSDDQLNMVLNGTNTTLPDPMFLVSEHDRKYDDMIKLWNFTEPYRREHQHRLREI